jgi:hypothetical protein
MKPHTVHRICQDIRGVRGLLTAEEKWARTIRDEESRQEAFYHINFWRTMMAEADRRIASGEASRAPLESGLESEISR